MPFDITMPKLGESVTEGTITRWLVAPGDRVEKYQPIAEVITDKVNAEIPSPEAGVILSLEVAEGTTVPVGALIARMEVPEGAAAGAPAPAAAAPAEPRPVATPASPVPAAAGGSAAPAGPAVPRAAALAVAPERPAAGSNGSGAPVRYSPAVTRLAQEHGIDLSLIRGTGLGGRVTRKDVERYLAARAAGAVAVPPAPSRTGAAPAPAAVPVPAAALAQAAAPAGAVLPAARAGDRAIPVTPVRRRIAERMVQARHEQPHAWTMVRADVTGLVQLRNAVREAFRAREGIDLTFMPFFIRAVVESLREYPMLNSTWAGDQIIVHGDIHISVAVATEDALVVPVIHHADRLSLAGLAHAVHDLAERARAGKLTLEDVQGGTFTVNNTGAFGSVASAPILNYPQAAILTLEAITKEPVVLENDAIAIRHMVNLCCSMDHRVLDGLAVGRFLQAVKRRLEAYRPGMEVV
ncbi:dihydrolipoamide acetyltransferase family protein [Caldinitratiruptor microaerophilus]|uniref:Dihydrolipoamide acetyltransferase component of pyruvate dehydrogenase complex n=1 Tax=Caldinitratiruptor microaerophilus TaxID=671077 RepID=A0AA35G8C3_9FIRM|nr:dihydrolipoamide acetyltransferase family protein [Caldinitratiruptor microaerophilus]BDG60921.1 dihydrolipoamide acetyltransferase component of pyruvate dehydrogenase complex [Caldinitratiruptor microaerophilus]